jgi:hypothetical protein
MENNERSTSKQFLSKIEEGQAKLYFDIGKRIHSYFSENLSETHQYIEQLIPQEAGTNTDDSANYSKLLQKYELLQEEFQKLKHTNERQLKKIQNLTEEKNDRLSKTTRTSSRKDAENNESEDSNHTDQPRTTTKKPRKSKSTKTVKTLTVINASDNDQSDIWDYEGMDLLNDQFMIENEENTKLDE